MDFIRWYMLSFSRDKFSDCETDEIGEENFLSYWNELQKKYKEQMEKDLIDRKEKQTIELDLLDAQIIENALRLYILHYKLYERWFYDWYYGMWNFIERQTAEDILLRIRKEMEMSGHC